MSILLVFVVGLIIYYQILPKNLAGKYGARGYENNYDTIWFRNNSTYKRKFIQKSTNQVFIQEGIWRLRNNRIYINYFYMNDDAEIIDDTIFKNLSSFGTSLMIDKTLTGFRLLQNGDLGWYYYKVK